MKTSQRVLLTVALAGLLIGIPVTYTHIKVAPLWTLALPVGVICAGCFLLTLLFRKEMARYDQEQHSKFDSTHLHSTSKVRP